ncbi:MAG TPA: hypothetical protein PKI62_09830 [bacterium]|nr:hypothetical protein [bacterium]HPR88811.1 hypothetical protein [bacterium]
MGTNPMTMEEGLLRLAQEWRVLGFAMVVVTLVSLLICYLLLKANRPVLAHRFMSLPIFLTMIPGIFYCVVLAYLLIFARVNLMTLPLFTYLPPLWMAISLYLYRQLIDFAQVPGFDRLSGLALFVTVIFASAFLLAKLRIIAVFWLSPKWLFPIVVVLYFGYRLAMRRMLSKE